MVRSFRNKQLNLIVQAETLRRKFPGSYCRTFKNVFLIWKGNIRPTPLSQLYKVRLRYKIGERPDTRIISPKLESYNNEPIPHVFSQERLCLYIGDEWTPNMNMADTIIPWVSDWLLYYEFWLVTGEWLGGGTHPSKKHYNSKKSLFRESKFWSEGRRKVQNSRIKSHHPATNREK